MLGWDEGIANPRIVVHHALLEGESWHDLRDDQVAVRFRGGDGSNESLQCRLIGCGIAIGADF